MHWVVTGLASRRLKAISSSHLSQIPNVPFSIRKRVLLIFTASSRSRSLMRSITDAVSDNGSGGGQ
jgi:hypothetical protein